jgi:FixJ family two-component response regulator
MTITLLYNSWAPLAHARVGLPVSLVKPGHGCRVSTDIAIAVIDDDESFRVALVESLLSLGYESSGYASAEDFVGDTGNSSFGCIVTDIHMPGMSGLDLIKKLAAQGWTVPAVLITARSDTNLEAKAAAAGASCLLRKPFEMQDLIDCIEGAVKA